MRPAPELERDQAPEEVRALYDVVEKLPGAPRLNRSAICDAFHSSLGRSVGLAPAELHGLADPSASPAYGPLERLVVRYARQLTVAGAVDDALHAALAARLPIRQVIELALTVAAANFANRVNAALKLDLEHSRP